MAAPDWNLWYEAERAELQGLVDQQVYNRIRLDQVPLGRQIVPCKLDYKRKACGRRKVRMVVRGDLIRPKPTDVYAPTPPMEAVRMMLSHAAQHHRHLRKWDVRQAFTQSNKLAVPIYVRPPPGIEDDPDIVWELVRPLYGLGIAPKAWSDTLIEFIRSQGWTPACAGEDTIYVKTVDGHSMTLLFWVDDILLSFDDESIPYIREFQQAFFSRFDSKDEGPVTQFLGIDIHYDRVAGVLTITQEPLIRDLLEEFGMLECNPVDAPMLANTQLLSADRSPDANRLQTKEYQHLVGTLQYLVTCTRVDCAYVAHQLSKHLVAPGRPHQAAAIRCLRYLKGTSSRGITYTASHLDPDRIISAADSDWAADPETRKSVTGNVSLMNGGAIAWKCRRQTGVATSSTEGEVMSASRMAQTVDWLRRLAAGLGCPQSASSPIFEDNRACRMISESKSLSSRMRHVDVSVHNVADYAARKIVKLVDCPTADMFADILTKALPGPHFQRHRDVIMGLSPRTTPALAFCGISLPAFLVRSLARA